MKAAKEAGLHITEFTVAPMIQQESGKSYHEWFVEFGDKPADMADFAIRVDNNLRAKNIYYDDLITGNILQPLQIRTVKKHGFIDYMKSVGKLGGQNKVPRLSNDRKLAAELEKYVENRPEDRIGYFKCRLCQTVPKKRIAIFGSTGSIGRQALEVIAGQSYPSSVWKCLLLRPMTSC